MADDEVRSVRVQSDGDPWNTVITLDDGTVLERVSGATVWLEVGEPVTVDLKMNMPVVDIHAKVSSIDFTCPGCGEVLAHECQRPLHGH